MPGAVEFELRGASSQTEAAWSAGADDSPPRSPLRSPNGGSPTLIQAIKPSSASRPSFSLQAWPAELGDTLDDSLAAASATSTGWRADAWRRCAMQLLALD